MMTDTDEYLKAQTKILADLADIENKGVMTKKEYILKLKDVTRSLIQSGYYPEVQMDDLCSLIGELLEKHNVSYSRTSLPALFDDDEKRTQHTPKNFLKEEVSKSPLEAQGIETIITLLNRARVRAYDVITDYDYSLKLNQQVHIAQKNVDHLNTISKRLLTAKHFVDYFESSYTVSSFEKMMQQYPKKIREQLDDILIGYHAAVLLQTETEKSIVDTYNETELNEIQSIQDVTSKNLDERRVLSTWQKITLTIAMKVGAISKNRAAKLNGIDKKHITNNIVPQNNPITDSKNKHHGVMEMLWFKTMSVVCAKCKHENVFDVTQKIEEDLSRAERDIQVMPTVLVNAVVEN